MLGLSREGFTWFEPLMQDFFFSLHFLLDETATHV